MATRIHRTAILLAPALALALGVTVPSAHSQGLPPPPAPAAFDPSDVYFQGWLLVRDAEKLQKEKDFAAALDKLQRARQLFDTISRHYADWKPEMVKGRQQSTAEAIAEVQPKALAQTRESDQAIAEIEGVVPNRDPGRVMHPPGLRPLPTTGIRPLETADSRRALELEAEVRRLREQLARTGDPNEAARDTSRVDDLRRQRDAVQQQLREREAVLQQLRGQLATTPVQGELQQLNNRIGDLERERAAMAAALNQSRSDQAETQARVAALQTDLDQARQQAADLERNLTTERQAANEVTRGQQEQLTQLRRLIESKNTDLASAHGRITQLESELAETRDAFAELRGQRDALLRERDHMAALLKLNEAGRVQDLVEQNIALAKELRLANERFDRLQTDNNSTKDELTEALRDLAIAKARIISLQKEGSVQQSNLAELEQRLRAAETELAQGGGNRDEAEMLREIIRRQLKIQERRRQAKDLLLAEVKQLGVSDKQLEEAATLLDGDELRLTPEESKLIADRSVDGEFVSPLAAGPTQRANAEAQAESDIASFGRAGTRAFAAGRLQAAEEVFEVMLESHPGHVPTLLKLGVVRLRRDDIPSAANAFRDAVAMNESNAYARRMLGITLYKLGNHEEAGAELRSAVALDPSDAKAHTYLGNTCAGLGDFEQAELHFKAAIQADPTLNEPYFNLAFLAARAGRKEQAQTFYQQALDNGAIPDPELVDMIEGRSPPAETAEPTRAAKPDKADSVAAMNSPQPGAGDKPKEGRSLGARLMDFLKGPESSAESSPRPSGLRGRPGG